MSYNKPFPSHISVVWGVFFHSNRNETSCVSTRASFNCGGGSIHVRKPNLWGPTGSNKQSWVLMQETESQKVYTKPSIISIWKTSWQRGRLGFSLLPTKQPQTIPRYHCWRQKECLNVTHGPLEHHTHTFNMLMKPVRHETGGNRTCRSQSYETIVWTFTLWWHLSYWTHFSSVCFPSQKFEVF